MSVPLTSPELALLRAPSQGSNIYAAIFPPSTVYTARLASVPASADKVGGITFTSGVGTLGDVLPDMDLWVGSTAGAHDLGIARIRKAPIAGVFYVGETSDIRWQTSCYLTVVNYYDLHPRHIYIDTSEVAYMDLDIAYSDQHAALDPVPIMGGHRVVKLTGVTAVTAWDGSDSWVIGSTISAYSWSCATALTITDGTTATPEIEFDTLGWHLVYLTVTAANGKTATGVRYVYVYDKDHLPEPIFDLGNPSVDYETGGWSFEFSMAAADVADIPDRALVLLFREDWYGSTEGSIGALAGCENIECVGKIAEEALSVDPEQGTVTFRVQGYHYWFQKIMGYPSGLLQGTGTPAAWTEMQSLTVDKMLWHLLHWRTTATVIMDVYLTDDARLASELSSPAANLWSQIQEIAFNTILARPGVDRFGRLWIRTEPQCVPVADRAFPNVMTIQAGDYEPPVRFDRVTVSDTGLIDLSGVAVDSSNNGIALFSLSPGHVMKHYGTIETIDRMLLEDQSLSNEQAGLLLAWRDNEYPAIEMPLTANNPVFDCFPPMVASWALSAGDNARGIEIDGDLIVRRVERQINADSGFVQTVVTFEPETEASLSNYITGDTPGSSDTSTVPTVPKFPPLPAFPIILPIDINPPNPNGPTKVVLHDRTAGLVYSANFDSGSPSWVTINAGLTPTQYQQINVVEVCPNGAIYVGYINGYSGWLARAPYAGGTFVMESYPNIIVGMAVNGTKPEELGILTNTDHLQTATFRVGANSSYVAGASFVDAYPTPGKLSYGFGYWLYTTYGQWKRIAPGGGSIVASGSIGDLEQQHMRASTTGRTFHNQAFTNNIRVGEGNLTSSTLVTISSGVLVFMAGGGSGYNDVICGDTDLTGNYIMTRGFGTAYKARSSDGGFTWVGIPNLPPGGWFYRYAGVGEGTASRWIAVSGSQIKFSTDWGDSWSDKLGNLTSIEPFPNGDLIRVVP